MWTVKTLYIILWTAKLWIEAIQLFCSKHHLLDRDLKYEAIKKRDKISVK
jgi:hypothetical protein